MLQSFGIVADFKQSVDDVVVVTQVVAHDRNFLAVCLHERIIILQRGELLFKLRLRAFKPLHVVEIFRCGQDIAVHEEDDKRQINSRQSLRR